MLAMTSLFRRLAVALVPFALVLGLLAPARADDPGKYYDGRIAYSQVVNCASIIWGSPYSEAGIGAYDGYYADPDSGIPAVNGPVYMHVVVYGLGNPCSGGTYFWPSIKLPANVGFYKSAPINCYYDGAPMAPADCPQWSNNLLSPGPNGSVHYWKNTSNAQDTWGIAQGHSIEFQFPVVGSQVMSSANLTAYLETADGNDNPTLTLNAPFYVFGGGSAPAVMYDQPSTYTSATLPIGGPSKFGILSEFQAVARGAAGTAIFQLGTKSGTYTQRVNVPITAGGDSWRIWTDWDEPTITPLTGGKKYYWRGGWDPGALGGGDVVWGAQQTFVAPGGATCLGRAVTVNLGLGELPTGGDDVILGTPGADTINAAAGNDFVCGLAGNDKIDGGDGNDLVDAGAGNDSVRQVEGDDGAKGGSGTDTISYAGAAAPIKLSLALATEQSTGAGLDIVTGFENAVGGSLADLILGNAGANKLLGTAGGDTLKGLAGTDTLVGGKGRDTCDGGTGKDTAATCEVKKSIP